MVFVLGVFLVPVNRTVGSGLSRFPFDTDGGFLLAAQVTQIPLVHNIEERSKLIAVLVVAVYAVGNGNKMNTVLPEHDFRVKTGLQIISADSAHVLYQNMSNLPGFNIRHQLLPCRSFKIASAPAVIGVVPEIGVTSLLCIAFQVLFLIYNGITIADLVIVTGQPLIQCRNFFFSLFHAHDALLSDCRLICGAFIISQGSSKFTVSFRIIRKILSSIVSVAPSLNTTLTL